MGVAQAPTPATKNYAVEKPLWTFVEHYSTKVHRVCSALGQQPAWSLSVPLPGKYASDSAPGVTTPNPLPGFSSG